MANAAILVGNIEYQRLSKLECCHDDLLAIKQLLEATEKYEEITIIENAEADPLKSQLRAAVDKVQSPEELLFYFTGHGLIVAHEVTNVGTDKSHLANMANQAKAALEAEDLEAFADRGYFKGEEILACDEAGITVTLPKPQTSEAKSEGRFGKQDFRYVAEEDIYICPAGEKLTNHFTNVENGLVLHHYWTNACRTCALKAQCTKGPQRRIKRWEAECVVDAVQPRLDRHPDAMPTRRETV